MVFKGSTRRSTSRDVPTTGPGLRLIANLAARSAQIRRKWEEGKRRGGESSKASSSLTILKIELPSCIPIQRRWIRSSGSKTMAEGAPKGGGKREREPPLIGRMIPANPENGGSPASLCQKLEGKWAKCHAFGRQKPGESPWTGWRWRGYVGRTKDSSIDSRSEEFSKRKESLALVNRGRGCFLPEWWNF